jgi:hypothetical protein
MLIEIQRLKRVVPSYQSIHLMQTTDLFIKKITISSSLESNK